MVKSGQQCVEYAQKLTKDVENSLTGADREQTLQIFGADPRAKTGDLLFYLADTIAITVQYANRTGLCKMLEDFQPKEFKDQLKILVQHAKDATVKIEDYDRM